MKLALETQEGSCRQYPKDASFIPIHALIPGLFLDSSNVIVQSPDSVDGYANQIVAAQREVIRWNDAGSC